MNNAERTPIIGGSENVKLRGDRVLVNNLEIVSVELVEYLAHHEDTEFALRELIDVALKVKALATSTVASQEINNKVDSLIKELESKHKSMIEKLETEAANLTDAEKGTVSTAIREMGEKTFKKLLAPEIKNEGEDLSPIGRFRELMSLEIKNYSENISSALTSIQTKLGVGVESQKTARDGTDFENNVINVVHYYGRIYGDTVEPTGAKSEVGTAKKGDVLVTLNADDTLGQRCAMVWEAKTDKTFKLQSKQKSSRVSLDKVRTEMEEALANRNAQCGVFVIDSDDLDLAVQPSWQELDGNKLILVLDRLELSEELVQLAYIWARWKAKASIGNFQVKVNSEGIKRTIETLRVQLKDLTKVTKHQNAAIGSIEEASSVVATFRGQVKSSLEELASMVNVELDALPESE